MWEYLIGVIIAILLGTVLYFLRMCLSYDCKVLGKDGKKHLQLPWVGLIEPFIKPSLKVSFSTYNALVFILPLVIISMIVVYLIRDKKEKEKEY